MTLAMKIVPRFPARVDGSGPITVTKENGVYKIAYDISGLAAFDLDDAATSFITIYDADTGTFGKLTIQALIDEIGTNLDPVLASLIGASDGILVKNGSDIESRTVTGTANEIAVANGDGVAGNPTISLPAAITLTGKTLTGGTLSGPTISSPTGLTKSDVGLGNVDNTADSAKSIATTQLTGTLQTAQFPSQTGDVTNTAGSLSTTIANDAVTFAKMQNIATDRLIGRDTASSGDPEEISVGGGLEFSGSGSIQRSALTGDVTASAGSGSTTIANDAVTYAKMQNVSATSRVLGRKTSGAGDVEELTLSEILDFISSAAQGDFLFRGASAWERIGAGTNGQVLTTGGPAADPSWTTVSGTGTVTSVGTGTGLTGGPVTTTGTISVTGRLADIAGITFAQGDILYYNGTNLVALAPGTNGQVLTTAGAGANPLWVTVSGTGTVTSVGTGTGLTGGPITGSGTISLSHLGIESLTDPNADRIMFWDDSGGASAWLAPGTYVAISGTTIDTTSAVAKLDVEDQALTGGTIVTSKSLGTITTGTVTPDPGDRPLQHYTNGGAHTLAPSSNTGSVLLDITNNGSAGAITTSGFTKVAGDSFTTTNGHKFRCHVSIGNGGSLLQVQAMQ